MSGDYISREAVLAQKGDCYDKDGHLLYAVGTGNILRIPAADVVEVRHRHWIPNSSNTRWTCSECGMDDNYAYNYSGVNFSLKLQDFYCPNCGAKMDGGLDE